MPVHGRLNADACSRTSALERWLYRLSLSPHADQFVLKGALMLVVWRILRPQ